MKIEEEKNSHAKFQKTAAGLFFASAVLFNFFFLYKKLLVTDVVLQMAKKKFRYF